MRSLLRSIALGILTACTLQAQVVVPINVQKLTDGTNTLTAPIAFGASSGATVLSGGTLTVASGGTLALNGTLNGTGGISLSGSTAVNLGSGTTTVNTLSASGSAATLISQTTSGTISQLSIDTTAGNTTDATQVAFRRNGASEWMIGNNIGNVSGDNFTISRSGTSAFTVATTGITVPGTSTLTGQVSATSSSGILTPMVVYGTGAAPTAGSWRADPVRGLTANAKVGSTYDLVINNPADTTNILLVPTGTNNPNFPGNVTITGTTGNILFLGSGGTTSATQDIIYNGPAASGFGPRILFNSNGANKNAIGMASGILGGTSNDFVIYSFSDQFKVYTAATLALTLTAAQLGQWGAAEADKFTNLTYASTISVNPALGNLFETTTVNATGNCTINMLNGGTAGQHLRIIIINDATSGKTVTWGTNIRPASATLVGVASKASSIVFDSDGTSWFEESRETGNL